MIEKMIPQEANGWMHQAIEASAGTGKTYTIETLMVALLGLAPERLPGNTGSRIKLSEILVVTFTEKAAGELRLRIRKKIADTLDALGKEPSPDRELQKHFEECLNHFDEAAIHTIHGFCRKYLDSFAFEGNLAMELELRDENELVEQVVRDQIREGGLDSLAPEDSKELLRKGPEALVRLVQDVLCGTSSEAEVILPNGIPAHEGPPQMHAPVWSSILPQVEELIQKDKLGRSEITPERRSLLRILLSENNAHEGVVKAWSDWDTGSLKDFLTPSLVNALDKATHNIFGERLRYAEAYRNAQFAQIWRSYLSQSRERLAQTKRTLGVQTFSDMIVSMERSLTVPDSPLLIALRSQFRFGLIDEFQDTNRMQWNIFRRIFVENVQTPLSRVLWLVGDPKQSIYSFQTADVATCMEAMRSIAPEGSLSLGKNYRSTPAMITSYNHLFARSEWFVDYPSVLPGRQDSEFTLPAPPADLPWGSAATVQMDLSEIPGLHGRRRALVDGIAGTIVHLVRTLQVPESSICVLVEKNREMDPMLEALRDLGIRASKGGETGLFASNECLQVIHLLQALLDPSELVYFRKAVLGPFLQGNLADLWDHLESETYWESYRMRLQGWQALFLRGEYESCFARIVADSALYVKLSAVPGGLRAIAAYRQIFAYALRCLRKDGKTLQQLVERLRSLYREEDTETDEENTFHRESGQDAVTLMTLHRSKGLEFPIVFLCTGSGNDMSPRGTIRVRSSQGFCIALIPTTDELSKLSQEQKRLERKRLWYVGLTRAKLWQFVPYWGESSRSSQNTATWFLNKCLDGVLENKDSFHCRLPIAVFQKLGTDLNPRTNTEESIPEVKGVQKPLLEKELQAAGVSRRYRVQTSYSALAHHGGASGNAGHYVLSDGRRLGTEDESGHAVAMGKEERKVYWETHLPPGADTGNALHGLFEVLDFAQVSSSNSPLELLEAEDVRKEMEAQFKRNRLWAGDTEARMLQAAGMLWNTLRAVIVDPVHGETFTLGSIPASERRAELEYHFRFNQDGSIFHQDSSMGGSVFGFMDLVFLHKGVAYVLDWKSNQLEDYTPESLEKAMIQNDYTLQASLYGSALRQFLSDWKVPFGGAIYMFIRGTEAGTSQGVWARKPEELDAGMPGIQARLQSIAQGGRHG